MLLAGVAILIGLHILATLPVFLLDRTYPFAPFSLDAEQNIPSLFSTVLLLFVTFCAYCIFKAESESPRIDRIRWILLAALFLFLALDESISIHERIDAAIRTHFSTEGFLLFVWVIPYFTALVAFVGVYLKFFMALPKAAKTMIFTGLTLYAVTMGIEMCSGAWVDSHGRDGLYYIWVIFEEALEMLGTICIIRGLLLIMDHKEQTRTAQVAD